MTLASRQYTPHNVHKNIKDARMSSMETLIKTIHSPSELAFCSYCSLHTTLDNYDDDSQMCLECKAKYELKTEVQNDSIK